MTFPPAVDLRAGMDQVYDHAAAAAFYPHAVVNALEARVGYTFFTGLLVSCGALADHDVLLIAM